METMLLEPGSDRWTSALERLQHDVYHLPAYVGLLADRADAEAAALLVSDGGDDIFVPLLLRPLPAALSGGGWRDGTSPYGYPGPLFSDMSPGRRRELWAGLVERAATEQLASLFLRTHPLLTPVPDGSWPGTTVVEHGRVVYVDLTEDLETIRGQRRGDTQRDLQALKEAGFQVVMNDWNRYDAFIRIYRDTMRRVGADPYYLFENGYFDGLREALDGGLHLCSVVAPDGETTAAGGLFMERGGIYQYHLGATNGEYRRQSPSKLMFDGVIEWARERSGTRLNLGGGLGGEEDSLFHFKKGWSDHTRPFHTLRVVPDEPRYRALMEEAGAEADDRSAFFPGYRETKA